MLRPPSPLIRLQDQPSADAGDVVHLAARVVEAGLSRMVPERSPCTSIQRAVVCCLGDGRGDSGRICRLACTALPRLEGRDRLAGQVADLLRVEVVKHAVCAKDEEVTLLHLKGVQLRLLWGIRPCLWCTLDGTDKAILPLAQKLREVRGLRQERQLVRAVEGVLLLARPRDATPAARERAGLAPPQQHQRGVAEVSDPELAAPVEHGDQASGRPERPCATEPFPQDVHGALRQRR
mmetsp:Transcript_127456/g.396767  ORF Transcript_127456/g.396767 Transcript_127456/m.396767 type:complete len:236 (-) Transcript_127456:198-905(-)